MDLVIFDQRRHIGAQSGAEPGKILPDPVGVVPAVGPQIQILPGSGGDAAQAGGKAMDGPGPSGVGTGIKRDAMALPADNVHGCPSISLMMFYFIPKFWF